MFRIVQQQNNMHTIYRKSIYVFAITVVLYGQVYASNFLIYTCAHIT